MHQEIPIQGTVETNDYKLRGLHRHFPHDADVLPLSE